MNSMSILPFHSLPLPGNLSRRPTGSVPQSWYNTCMTPGLYRGVCLLACLLLGGYVMAEVSWYVAPDGDDAWSGQLAAPNAARTDGPFRTVRKACEVARPGETCYLRGGVYRETLRPARSGEEGRPIVFRNYAGETPVISGADLLAGWTADGPVRRAPMPWSLDDGNQLFVDGAMLPETRWPHNAGTLLQPTRAAAAAGTAQTLTDPALPADVDFTGALLWCAGGDRWVCWSERVTGCDTATHTLSFTMENAQHWYTVRPGSPYVLMGCRATLAPGEWWYDRAAGQMLVMPPAGLRPDAVLEAKRRLHCIDLSGRSHVQIAGVHFRAGGVLTDAATHHITFDRCTGTYVGHSYQKDVAGVAGVLIRGHDNTVTNCELAWSSSSILRVEGRGHRIVNNFIHDGNYAGKWNGTVSLAGRKILFSHNTVRHSGRDLVSIHRLMESLVQYNDLSDAGWITCDLGMTYGHDTDFMNTVIRFNTVHDNHAAGCAMGIYFDHCSHNVIVHHNAVYRVDDDPIRINNPSYGNLVFHNSCAATGGWVTFDHSHRNDLFGCRVTDNLVNKPINLPAHVTVARNVVSADPGYVDAARGLLALKQPLPGNPGAFAPGQPPWRAGHDFAHPPTVAFEDPDYDWMNTLYNACFELGTLEGWTAAGAADITAGNGWGNLVVGKQKNEATGTSKHELHLHGKLAGVAQAVTGLHPRTPHTLSGWVRGAVRLGVRLPDGTEHWSPVSAADAWTRLTVAFTTGDDGTARVLVEHTADGDACVDNLLLPRATRHEEKNP
jgi:hypothetical protein